MKNLHKNLIMTVVCLISFNLAFAPTFFAYAVPSITDLNAQKKALEEKAKQAAAAQAQKEKEAAALSGQITYVNNQITQTQSAIISTDNQVSATQKKIAELGESISVEEANLVSEQKTMDRVIASLYMEGDSGLLESLLSSNSISEAITNQQYYESIQQQVEGTIQRITKIKTDLSDQKNQKDKQLADLTNLKISQIDQKKFLEGRKSLKSELLSDAKTAVQSLEAEQTAAKAAIADLQARIDRIKAASIGAGGDLVSANDASWYYRQTDERWASEKLGLYATIGDYGCLLTSLTMVAKFYGKNYTPLSALNSSSFVRTWGRNDGALISTSIVNDGKSQPVDWSVIDNELANGHPVIVGVALGVDMGNSYGVSHFVVIKSKIGTDKYAMHDPLGDARGYRKSQIKAMRIIRP